MKKMNNLYAAPKAEVIELNVCRDLMQMGTGGHVGGGSMSEETGSL